MFHHCLLLLDLNSIEKKILSTRVAFKIIYKLIVYLLDDNKTLVMPYLYSYGLIMEKKKQTKKMNRTA